MQQNKTVLFISIDGMTDPLGQSQVIPYLKGLSQAGYNIHIISAEKEQPMIANEAKIRELLATANIQWSPIEYQTSPPLVSSVKNINNLFSVAEAIHQKTPVSMAHCRSYLPMFAGLRLKKKYGIKVLFDIRGFWPDERVDGGLWKLSNPFWKFIYTYFKRKEKIFFENADHVVSLTEVAKKEILCWDLKNNPIPIDVIPCCADLDHFNYNHYDDSQKADLRKELNLREKDFVLTYLGSVGTFYALDEMMTFFKLLKEKKSNAKFLIITASSQDTIWESALKIGIEKEDLRIVKSPREKVPLYLSISDYSLIFYKENFSRKACSPTKLGELMGLGVPSICSPNIGDTTRIIEETHAGCVIQSLDTASFQKVIDELNKSDFNKAAIRKKAFLYFDVEEGIKKYIDVYQKVLK